MYKSCQVITLQKSLFFLETFFVKTNSESIQSRRGHFILVQDTSWLKHHHKISREAVFTCHLSRTPTPQRCWSFVNFLKVDGCQSLYRYFVILVQQYNCIYLLLFIYEDRGNILIYLRISTEINATSNLPIATSTGILLLLPLF